METKQICFSCPKDLYDWLLAKKNAENRKSVSNAVVSAIYEAMDGKK